MGWFSSSPMERETKRGIVEMRRLEHEARMRHDAELAAVALDADVWYWVAAALVLAGGIVEMRRLEHEARMRHYAELAAVARDLKQKLREQGRARGWFR